MDSEVVLSLVCGAYYFPSDQFSHIAHCHCVYTSNATTDTLNDTRVCHITCDNVIHRHSHAV